MQRHWTVDAVRGGAVAGAGLSGGLGTTARVCDWGVQASVPPTPPSTRAAALPPLSQLLPPELRSPAAAPWYAEPFSWCGGGSAAAPAAACLSMAWPGAVSDRRMVFPPASVGGMLSEGAAATKRRPVPPSSSTASLSPPQGVAASWMVLPSTARPTMLAVPAVDSALMLKRRGRTPRGQSEMFIPNWRLSSAERQERIQRWRDKRRRQVEAARRERLSHPRCRRSVARTRPRIAGRFLPRAVEAKMRENSLASVSVVEAAEAGVASSELLSGEVSATTVGATKVNGRSPSVADTSTASVASASD